MSSRTRAGEIVRGTVRRFERSDVIMDLGKFDAIMPSKERVVTEDYNVGDQLRAYVMAVGERDARAGDYSQPFTPEFRAPPV